MQAILVIIHFLINIQHRVQKLVLMVILLWLAWPFEALIFLGVFRLLKGFILFHLSVICSCLNAFYPFREIGVLSLLVVVTIGFGILMLCGFSVFYWWYTLRLIFNIRTLLEPITLKTFYLGFVAFLAYVGAWVRSSESVIMVYRTLGKPCFYIAHQLLQIFLIVFIFLYVFLYMNFWFQNSFKCIDLLLVWFCYPGWSLLFVYYTWLLFLALFLLFGLLKFGMEGKRPLCILWVQDILDVDVLERVQWIFQGICFRCVWLGIQARFEIQSSIQKLQVGVHKVAHQHLVTEKHLQLPMLIQKFLFHLRQRFLRKTEHLPLYRLFQKEFRNLCIQDQKLLFVHHFCQCFEFLSRELIVIKVHKPGLHVSWCVICKRLQKLGRISVEIMIVIVEWQSALF